MDIDSTKITLPEMDVDSEKVFTDLLGIHSCPVTTIAVGHYDAVISGGVDGMVNLWKPMEQACILQDKVGSGWLEAAILTGTKPVTSVCFTDSDSDAITGCEGGV